MRLTTSEGTESRKQDQAGQALCVLSILITAEAVTSVAVVNHEYLGPPYGFPTAGTGLVKPESQGRISAPGRKRSRRGPLTLYQVTWPRKGAGTTLVLVHETVA